MLLLSCNDILSRLVLESLYYAQRFLELFLLIDFGRPAYPELVV